jgi:hypothetical protein
MHTQQTKRVAAACIHKLSKSTARPLFDHHTAYFARQLSLRDVNALVDAHPIDAEKYFLRPSWRRLEPVGDGGVENEIHGHRRQEEAAWLPTHAREHVHVVDKPADVRLGPFHCEEMVLEGEVGGRAAA